MRKRIFPPLLEAGLIAVLWIIIMALSASAQELSAANVSKYAGDGRWDWTVFIRAHPEVLQQIRSVEYRLHPTFRNPNREVDALGDPQYPFGLSSNGWGVFEISIRVIFNDGRVQHLKHMLSFEPPAPREALPITAGNVATQVRTGLWQWTVFIQGPEEALAQVRCVVYTLHHTFYNPVREVCSRGESPQAFALSATGWGTFTIQIRVYLVNGEVQELEHTLEF